MHHYRAFTQFAALLSPIEAERNTKRLDNGKHSRFMQLQEENGGAGRNRTNSAYSGSV